MKKKYLLIFEIAKYALGCGFNLGLKTALNAILTFFDFPLFISYLIAQIIILFSSFLYHYKITFARSFDSWEEVLKAFQLYVPNVFFFIILDYLLVVCLAGHLNEIIQTSTNISVESQQVINSLTILMVSGMIFVLRFIVYRVIFKKQSKSPPRDEKKSPDAG